MSMALKMEETTLIVEQKLPEIVDVVDNTGSSSTWRSCCLQCDKSALVFFSQLTLSACVIIFCIIQLYRSVTCDKDGLYSGIMMVILGSFLPTPKIKR